ncbi:HYES hydrolase, partial [Erythrocercus mccallii]|nr:HYES hydrolase [Erythrocercus mccallii]
GFRTCALTNSWLDDGSGRFLRAALLQRLRSRFHVVLESCRIGMRKPQTGIYARALRELRARPQEV